MQFLSSEEIPNLIAAISYPPEDDEIMRIVGPARSIAPGPSRVPFASGPEGDTYCVDMVPIEGGAVGQIVHISWEICTIEVLASSLLEYLHLGVGLLKREVGNAAA
jgi:cell wall assembly regulator SMI1